MRKDRLIYSMFTREMLLLCIIGPITIMFTGCSTGENNLNTYSRRDYLPNSYSTNFVLGGSSNVAGERYLRDPWPRSENAVRAIKSEDERVYERSSYSYNTTSKGRPHDNYSYRIVTTSVK